MHTIISTLDFCKVWYKYGCNQCLCNNCMYISEVNLPELNISVDPNVKFKVCSECADQRQELSLLYLSPKPLSGSFRKVGSKIFKRTSIAEE